MKNFKYWLMYTVEGYSWRVAISIVAMLFLLIFSCSRINCQSFQLVSEYPFVITQVKYDSLGNEYVIRQQGSLTKNGDTIKVFPTHFINECGLVGFDLAPDGFLLHISGQDSAQRVLRFDTILNEIDTIVEVYYNAPFSSRHRGGGVFYADSVVYCTFGYGAIAADAQNLEVYRGKLLKVNLDSMTTDIVAFGLRNPYRFDFNPELNEGFTTDVGSNVAEEINYFTGDYSLLNMGWPCYEDTIQLLDPDTLCSGYAYSFPEYSYNQSSPRSIIGGCFWEGNYYFADHYTGFGGYLDSNWVFNEFPIPFPQYVTSMAVNPLNNTLRVSTWAGDIYEYVEPPLSIDEEEEVVDPPQIRGINITYETITWDDRLTGTLILSSIDGRVITTRELSDAEFIDLDGLPPGVYVVAIYTSRGIEFSRKFITLN
jgi:hypothetical protein